MKPDLISAHILDPITIKAHDIIIAFFLNINSVKAETLLNIK